MNPRIPRPIDVIMGIFLIFMASGVSCSWDKEDEFILFPDFSSCNCTISYDPVCDVNGRNYLNECYAQCIQAEIQSVGNCPDSLYQVSDTMTWPIEKVCIPIETNFTPRTIRNLGDGTVLYQRPDGTYFRGMMNLCRCLPGESLIATAQGKVPISQLGKGDSVWTRDFYGKPQLAPIVSIRRVEVGADFYMVKLRLADGRSLKVSPLHPNKNGLPLGSLQLGDSLDGSTVVGRYWEKFEGAATWDIRPAGHTGLYIVNGICIGSTLPPQKETP